MSTVRFASGDIVVRRDVYRTSKRYVVSHVDDAGHVYVYPEVCRDGRVIHTFFPAQLAKVTTIAGVG